MKRSTRAKGNDFAPASYAARIKVVGIGGCGGNAISRMNRDIRIRGIEFIAINTDAQDLDYCEVKKKICIGKNLTRGLGTGMNPDLGRQAAEESRSEIVDAVKDADLVFIAGGFGGGTCSGAAPIVAEIAREQGSLTIGIVTKPFSFEGSQRSRIAQDALIKLKEKVDTLIVIPNDRIFSVIRKDTPLLKAFEFVDDVLRSAVEGIADLIAAPGIINLDFADVKAVMKDAGPALVGIGVATGQERAQSAVNQVVNSPLLEIEIDGAKGVLFGVATNRDLKMTEINEIAKVIAAAVDPSAKIIFGAYHDRKLKQGQLKVTLIATGFNGQITRSVDVSPSLFTVGEPVRTIREVKEKSQEEIDKKKKTPPLPKLNGGEHEKPGASDDTWEIPAFLRKKH